MASTGSQEQQLKELFTQLSPAEQDRMLSALRDNIAAQSVTANSSESTRDLDLAIPNGATDSGTLPPASSATPALASSTHQTSKIPYVNVNSKKQEYSSLLGMLDVETQRLNQPAAYFASSTGAMFSPSSIALGLAAAERDDVLTELGASVVDWLPELWGQAVWRKERFADVHEGLMASARVVESLMSGDMTRGTCMCSFDSMLFLVNLTLPSGECAKRFEVDGGAGLEPVLAWIWRDLLLSILSTESDNEREFVEACIKSVESNFGWQALAKIVTHDEIESDYVNDEDVWEDEPDYIHDNAKDVGIEVVDDDHMDREDQTSKGLSPHYWTAAMQSAYPVLKSLISKHLFTRFAALPSLPLFETITKLTTDPTVAQARISTILSSLVPISPDALCAALHIYSSTSAHDLLTPLFYPPHLHLLTPSHTPALIAAFKSLSPCPGHLTHALWLAHTQIQQIITSVLDALLPLFPGLNSPLAALELQSLLGQRSGTAARQGRLEAWCEAIAVDPNRNAEDDDLNGGQNGMALFGGGIGMFGMPAMFGAAAPAAAPGAGAAGGAGAGAGAAGGAGAGAGLGGAAAVLGGGAGGQTIIAQLAAAIGGLVLGGQPPGGGAAAGQGQAQGQGQPPNVQNAPNPPNTGNAPNGPNQNQQVPNILNLTNIFGNANAAPNGGNGNAPQQQPPQAPAPPAPQPQPVGGAIGAPPPGFPAGMLFPGPGFNMFMGAPGQNPPNQQGQAQAQAAPTGFGQNAGGLTFPLLAQPQQPQPQQPPAQPQPQGAANANVANVGLGGGAAGVPGGFLLPMQWALPGGGAPGGAPAGGAGANVGAGQVPGVQWDIPGNVNINFNFAPPLGPDEDPYGYPGPDGSYSPSANDATATYASGLLRTTPRLGSRLHTWLNALETVIPPGAAAGVLDKVYDDIVKVMPWIVARDCVAELMTRCYDYPPGASGLAEPVRILASFVRTRRRTKRAAAKAKAEKEKRSPGKRRRTRTAAQEEGEEEEGAGDDDEVPPGVTVIVPQMLALEPDLDGPGLDDVD